MIKKLEDILEKSKNLKKARLAVASAEDYEVLKAVKDAYEIGVIEPILVGDEKKIIEYAKEIGFDLENIRVISSTSLKESAMVSVAFACLLLWINSCIVEAERSLIVF